MIFKLGEFSIHISRLHGNLNYRHQIGFLAVFPIKPDRLLSVTTIHNTPATCQSSSGKLSPGKLAAMDSEDSEAAIGLRGSPWLHNTEMLLV